MRGKQERISRRGVVRKGAAFGLSLPLLGSTLASCASANDGTDDAAFGVRATPEPERQPIDRAERRSVPGLSLEPGPLNAITDVRGIQVGHYTHDEVPRGVTAVLCPHGAAAGVSVQGANPGTLNTDALGATTISSLVHGIGLTGGSLFGLSATTGMTQWLHERGRGLRTAGTTLPITAGAVIFDLTLSNPRIAPTAEWGHLACDAATDDEFERGSVGVGAGATAGKGPGAVRAKGGLGTASLQLPGDIIVGALVVVNSMGGLIHPGTGELFATSGGFDDPLLYRSGGATSGADPATLALANTTLGVVATNADLDKAGLIKVSELAHHGLARAIRPMHTMLDGDTIFTLAPLGGRFELPGVSRADLIDMIGAAAADAMVLAVLDSAEQTSAFDQWPSVADAQAEIRGN